MNNNEVNKLKLIEKINKLRIEMISISNNSGINSTSTLNCSQKLDKLIYTYQVLKQTKA
ncbi:aspartyl-phosphate phosphatase Spo0E family protein [Cytobacillus purgationiresistens]|uniref:Spo0E like sporulation regulatory protein n=1 Tax=Cytobacillus purgationiresistens TaxID=863449 RepID=A0ABU0ACP5_9BACI|nr:aspartyl-phosphate phosphatase Spo0E family protein [Cytobacillus purgationiresistens]MDQ0269022.1 hypothetical protein [Cytobacillus purgationiresistens]